jgi:DNA-binding response OmpR family regulator
MQIKKLLMVDDDRSIRRIAEIILTNATDWQIEIAGSGQEALEKIKVQPPDVVLLDVMMPGMDGIATLTIIREELKLDLPIILLTARTESDDMKAYANLNLAGVITKPFEPTRLANQITSLVSGWRDQCSITSDA